MNPIKLIVDNEPPPWLVFLFSAPDVALLAAWLRGGTLDTSCEVLIYSRILTANDTGES